ncbi:hypothetical protein ACQJBY_031326 [Aegilops geniculata]
MAVMESAKLNAAEKKAVRKKVGGGWDPTYTKRSFFPYWRSVLQAGVPLKEAQLMPDLIAAVSPVI